MNVPSTLWAATLLVAAVSFPGCQTPAEPAGLPRTGPYVLVLGTAQDGGLPHIGCEKPCCTAAWEDPARRRLVSSLLLVDPRSGKRWLFDASPELPLQYEIARNHPPERAGDRPPPFDGIFLTHAHMGHYIGLAQFGREAYGVHDLAVHATDRMAAFLRGNDPWRFMVEHGALRLNRLEYEQTIELAPDLYVTPFRVPHREEFSDVVGFRIRGPSRAVLYLPDIDKWGKFDRSIEKLIGTVDIALLDGTFFADGEIPGRSLEEIPHPFIVESIDRFAILAAGERRKIHLTHLNHTNPAADPASPEAQQVVDAGMNVLRDGMVFGL